MIKTVVLGCGNIGKRHIAVFDNNPDTSLLGVFDIRKEEASLQKEAYHHTFEAYPSLSQALASGADLISICTPHHLHKTHAIQSLAAGKHVLVEKPLTLKTKDAEEMVAMAKKADRRMYVMKQNRFNVPVVLTHEALTSGKLGQVYMVQCHVYWNRNPEYYAQSDWRGKRSAEGGALFTQASHFIDLLTWWFGGVDQVNAVVDTKMQKVEIEDCGHALFTFHSGVQGAISWTTCTYNKNYEGSITLIGEKGTIKIGGAYLNQIDYWDVKSSPLSEHIHFSDTPNHYGKYRGTSSNHHKVVAEMVKDLHGKASSYLVEAHETIASIDMLEKIYQSAGYHY